jgi:HlyD family secretion protein
VAEEEPVVTEQVLAHIECADAEAEAAAARSEVVRLGPRTQEVQVAAAEVKLAEARLAEASRACDGSRFGWSQVASRARIAGAERDDRVAAAQLEAARQRLRLLEAGPRPEEVAEARARADAAWHAAAVAAARLARCEVHSAIRGIVLRKHVSAGEFVSVAMPQPLFTVADLARARVRAEADERDLGGIAIGQAAVVVPGDEGAPRLSGRVAKIGRRMGRRRVLAGDPAERNDRDVLEVVINLEDDAVPPWMPVGLRGSVLFFVGTGGSVAR